MNEFVWEERGKARQGKKGKNTLLRTKVKSERERERETVNQSFCLSVTRMPLLISC